MNNAKKTTLESQGWVSGSTADFLELTPEEAFNLAKERYKEVENREKAKQKSRR